MPKQHKPNKPSAKKQSNALAFPVGYESTINDMSAKICPVVLCLDISGSMAEVIDYLKAGLEQLHHELTVEQGGCPWVDLCILTFRGRYDDKQKLNLPVIGCLKPFGPLSDWHLPLPELQPSGTTWIGSALLEAKHSIETWREAYENKKGRGAAQTPRLFLMTDGLAGKRDYAALDEARSWLWEAIAERRLHFNTIFCCPLDQQNTPIAKEAKRTLRSLFPANTIYDRQPYVYGTDRLAFRDFLHDVSVSISTYSPNDVFGQR